MFCSHCGKQIYTADSFYELEDLLPDDVFCCENCAKEHLIDNIDKVVNNNITEDFFDDADDYTLYGVSERDFR